MSRWTTSPPPPASASGTAYRRFANREELVDALFDEHIATMIGRAEAAAASPTPGRAW